MKKTFLSTVFSLIIAIVFIACGGGGGGGSSSGGGSGGSGSSGSSGSSSVQTTNISGQATLGPLSNADIRIYDLNNTLIGEYKANSSSTDLDVAGSFSIDINSTDLPDVFILTATGGTDIDSQDTGNTANTVDNNGTIHAIIKKDDLNGSLIINPLTEIVYNSAIENFGDDLSSYSTTDIDTFIQSEASKYLTDANATYQDLLKFNPRLDKAKSKIDWDTILDKVVSSIHKGESSSNIQQKVKVIKTYTKDLGVYTSDDNATLEQYSEDANNNRIVTKIEKSDDNSSVSSFSQEFISDDGEIVSIEANKINDTYSFVKAKINKDGHEFKIEGKTTLLQGLSFDASTISNYVNSLISVEKIDENSTKITVDKKITNRLSDNEVKIYIDGREPLSDEFTIIDDDPVIGWDFTSTSQNLPLNKVFTEYSDINRDDVVLKKTDDDLLIFEMGENTYYNVSGILNDSFEATRSGWEALIGDSFFSFIGGTLGRAASMYGDAEYLLNTGLPLTFE